MRSFTPRFPRVQSRSARRRSVLNLEALESRRLLTYTATLSGTSAIFTGSGAGETLTFDASGGLLRHNTLTAPAGQAFASDFDFDSIVPGDQTLAEAATSFVTVQSNGAGADTVNIGTPSVPADQLLAGFTLASFGTGNDVLNVDNSGSAAGNTYDFSSTGITGTNLSVTNTALFRGGVNLLTGTAANVVNIPDSFLNQPETVAARALLVANIGSAGTLQTINSGVTLTNSNGGMTQINLDDSSNTANVTGTIGASSITGLAPSTITYGGANVTSLQYLGGSGDNTYTIQKSFPTTIFNAGLGNDDVTILGSGLASTGTLLTDGSEGFDTLTVDAGGSPVTVTPGVIQVGTKQPIDYTNYESITIKNAANTPPVITAQTFPATAGKQAVNVTVATFTDTDPNDTASTFTSTIHWGDGTTSAGTVTQDASTPSIFYVTGTHTYQTPGNKSVTVDVKDLGTTTSTIVGGVPLTTSTIPVTTTSTAVTETVADAPIDATGVNIVATEGQAVPITTTVATFTSSNPYATAGTYNAVIDWGDGTATTNGTITATGTSPNGVTFSVMPSSTHTYSKEGNYPVTVTITTTAGTAGIANSLAMVQDGTITVTGMAVDATAGTPINAPVATFVDNGGAETANSYNIVINWGDGTTGPGYISSSTTSGGVTTYTVSGHHTYSTPTSGPVTAAVTVTTAGGTSGLGTFTTNVHGLNSDFGFLDVTEGQPLNNAVLATLSSNGGPAIVPSNYTATADWGDGSPVTPVSINSMGQIIGSHTYREHGVFPVVITVATTGNPNLLTFTRGIIVNDVPINLQGHLDASSDSGISNSDGITNVVQPTFVGTSEPLSTIAIDAVPGAGGDVIRLGTATTNSSGAWTITSNVPLADGAYTINAHAVDQNGSTMANTVLGNILIDTVGPRVTDFVFNRPAGEVLTTLQDNSSGLAQQTIIDNAFYSITKPRLNNGTYLFTSLTATGSNGPTSPQTVTGVINNHLKLRGGVYTFTLKSGGVTDVAGNALDGEFYGYLPSGNGHPGGDFVAVIDTVHRQIYSPKPTQGFGSPNVPPGALLPSYIIGPGNTIAPRGPRFHLHGGTGNLAGMRPAQAHQAAHHRTFAGIFSQRHHKPTS